MTRHPLFPAIVALWFGALFGLGSLAIRASLLETAVVASRIDLVIPAAAPPLGVTARILLALALAVLGGILGALIGLGMARAKPAAPQHRREDASPAEEEESWANPAGLDDLPQDEHPEYPRTQTSLPGNTPAIINLAELGLGKPLGEEARGEAEPVVPGEPAIAPATSAISIESEQPLANERLHRAFDPPQDMVAQPAPFQLPGGRAAELLTSASLDTLSHVQLIERLALSLQKRRELAEQTTEIETEVETEVAISHSDAAESLCAEPDGEDEPADDTGDECYSSLLEIGRIPPRQPFIPIDDEPASESAEIEPAVIFPSQAARALAASDPVPVVALRQDPEETERALRAALATLQRMSGAA